MTTIKHRASQRQLALEEGHTRIPRNRVATDADLAETAALSALDALPVEWRH